ncbi:MAG: hypothetical protein K0S25_1007 [Bacillus sp. (in: firmicutes)]|nr:hypothetical protein [Bacillus sp. (in: firmicutes)]
MPLWYNLAVKGKGYFSYKERYPTFYRVNKEKYPRFVTEIILNYLKYLKILAI